MSRVFKALPTAPGASGTRPTVLFIAVGALDGDGHAIGTGVPGEIEELVAAMARITPFDAAILGEAIAMFWSPTGAGHATGPEEVTGAWVLDQLVGADLECPAVRLLTAGDRLPYAIGHADVLPVVVGLTWSGAPREGYALGAVPYFVAVGTLDIGGAARTVAKALGKVLGLGEESADPAQMSAPDWWGRSLPNVWYTKTPTVGVPWAHLVSGPPVEGAFGLATSVYRAEADCLMGDPLGDGEAFCKVCEDHLRRALLGGEVELDYPIAQTGARSGELGKVTFEPWPAEPPAVLWDRVVPKVRAGSGPVAADADPDAEGVGLTLTAASIGARVVLRCVSYRTSLGPTLGLVCEVTLANARKDVVEVVLRIEKPIFAATDGTVPAIEPMRWSTRHMEMFASGLAKLLSGSADAGESAGLVLGAAGWWLPVDETDQDGPALGFHHPVHLPLPYPGPTGAWLVDGGTADQWTRVWPTALQGEAAPGLIDVLTRDLPTPLLPAIAVHERLAYVQATGISERWRPALIGGDGECTWSVDGTTLQITARIPAGGTSVGAMLLWATPGIPLPLERVYRLVLGDETRPTDHVPSDVWTRMAAKLPELTAPAVDATRDAATLMEMLAFLGSASPGDAATKGVVAGYVVLSTIRRWAVDGRINELVRACVGLDAALVAVPAWAPGWPTIAARVRAMLGEQLGFRAALLTRRSALGGFDIEAIRRTSAAPSIRMIEDLRGTGGAALAIATIEAVTDHTLTADDVGEGLALSRSLVAALRALAGAVGFGSLHEVADEIWQAAVVRYLSGIDLALEQKVPALHLLAETRPEARAALLEAEEQGWFSLVPTARRAELADARDEASVVAWLLERATHGTVREREVPHFVGLAQIGGAIARSGDVHREAAEAAAEVDPAGFPPVIEAAAVQDHRGWHTLRDARLLQRIDGLVVSGSRSREDVVAEARQALGVSKSSYARRQLQVAALAGNADDALAVFSAFPLSAMQELVADAEVAGWFADEDTFPPRFFSVFQALAALAEPLTADEGGARDGSRIRMAAHRAWQVEQVLWSLSGTIMPRSAEVDRQLARYLHTVRGLSTAARAALKVDPEFQAATDSILDWLGLEGPVADALVEATTGDLAQVIWDLTVEKRDIDEENTDVELIVYREAFAEHLATVVASQPERVVLGVKVDGAAMMRMTSVVLAHPEEGWHPEVVAVHDLLADQLRHWRRVIEDSLHWDQIDREVADQYADVIYGTPSRDARLWDVDSVWAADRAAEMASTRGALGFVFMDPLSASGPELDEALTRLQLLVERVSRGAATSADTAELVLYSADCRSRVDDLVASRRAIADVATGMTAAILATGITIGTGGLGAPLATGLLAAAAGGTGAMVARQIIEGPAYVDASEAGTDFVQGAAEGAIDAATGWLLLKGATALVPTAFANAGMAADDVVVGAARGLDLSADAVTPGQRAVRILVYGVLQESLNGAGSEVVQTALDEATWNQSVMRTMAALAVAAARGAAIGGLFGAAGGLFEDLLHVLPVEETADRVVRWIARHGRLDELRGGRLTADQLDALIAARKAIEDAGDLDEIKAALRRDLGDDDLADDLVGPDEQAEIPLRRSAKHLSDIVSQHVGTKDPLGHAVIELDVDKLLPEGKRAQLYIESVDPPRVRVLVSKDVDVDGGTLDEELIHILQVVHADDETKRLLALLTEEALEEWPPDDPLPTLAAYFELEIDAQRKIIAAYDLQDVDANPAKRAAMMEAEDALEAHLDDLALIRGIEATGGSVDDFYDIDLPPRLASTAPLRATKYWGDRFPAEKDNLDAAWDARRAEVMRRNVTEREVSEGIVEYTDANGDKTLLVQVPGIVRLTRGDVLRDGAPDPTLPVRFGDLDGFSGFRSKALALLQASFVQTRRMDRLVAAQTAERILVEMETTEVGFVLGTSAMRAFNYRKGYVTETGMEISEDGDLHHMLPLFLLPPNQLGIDSHDPSVALSLVDMPKSLHRQIHALMTTELSIVRKGVSVPLHPSTLRKHFEDNLRPGTIEISKNGSMKVSRCDSGSRKFDSY